jgi:Tfp pilus assembly protein PilF
VLEGSVRKSSNRLRITAQLIQVDSGFHLWSETYEREIDDIFAIQDDISAAITKALEAELGATSLAPSNQSTENIEAYQLYLEARFLLAKRGEANLLQAHKLFEQSVSMDPMFSSAWSGMAYNYALLPSYGGKVSARQAREIVKVSANKAIQLDPENAEAYVALGLGNYLENLKVMQGHYEKAYQLAPNNADVLNLYADFMSQTGDLQAAERMELEAIELDPLAAVHYSDITFVMNLFGRNAEGLEYARTSANLAPDSIDRADALVVSLIMTGKYDEAMQIIRHFQSLSDSNADYINIWLSLLYYRQGNEPKLREMLAERLHNMEFGSGEFGYALTAFYTLWLDGTDAALPLLEKAYARQEWILTWSEFLYLPEDISDDPAWLAFWQQPRLAELMEIRRENKSQQHFGYWNGQTVQ